MIARIVTLSVRRRGWVLVLWTIAALGLLAVALKLKLDALPDVTSNQVQVLTGAPGLTPEEVEQRVTRPLEASFGGLPGLATVRSQSRYGLSAITLVFDEDVELLRARQLVAERMASSEGARAVGAEAPELGPLTGGLGEVFHFTVSSPTRTPTELLELVELRATPVLKTVPGVVEVNTWGGARRTLEVRADVNALATREVRFEELRDALARSVGSRPGASLEVGTRHVLLRGTSLPRTPEEVGALLVRVDERGAVRVGDVATVAEGAAPRLGVATRNGASETVYVMAQMLLGANAREVTAAVRERMPDVQAALPADVRIEPVYDRSALVNATLRTVAKSLAEGGALVCLVLFLMLGSARAGVVVALTIPLSMLGATAAMTLLGVSGNLMSLGAVDFGLLVDGAVVLVEHVFHTAHRDAEDPRPWDERVAEACAAVARPSFFGVFVILLVYVPVLTLTGVDGKLFRPMAITVVLALLTALLLTLTFIPAACALALRPKDVPHHAPFLVRVVDRVHAWALGGVVGRPGLVLAGALLSLAGALAIAARLGTELAPTLDEGAIVVQTTRAADTGLDGAVEQTLALERALLAELPEVASVTSRIGSPAVATDTMGLEQADIFLELAPHDRWRPGLTEEGLVSALAESLERHAPGAEPAITQPIQMRFNELLGGAPYDVVVSVLGQELGPLREAAARTLAVVQEVEGVEDPRVLAVDEVPLLDVRPSPLVAGQRGLTAGEVLDLAGAVRLGLEVGTTFDGPRAVPVVLRLGGEAPHPLALGATRVPLPEGRTAPLGDVATIATLDVPAALYRVDGERRMVLGFNVRGRELGAVVEEASARVRAEVRLPEGVRLAWGGQYSSLEEARRRLMLVIPAVLALIGLVLFVHFGRAVPVLWVLAHVPFAAVGGVVALAARGMSLSISAGIGFIALWGIAVMNGTVLVTAIEELESAGSPPREATLAAARSRTRPVTMTAMVAAFGFLPMALATGVGSEVQRPLATVVIGGLVSSTTLTLLVLPTLRAAVARWRSPGSLR